MSQCLTRDQFIGLNLEREKVAVPGGYVWVRGMTARERGVVEAAVSKSSTAGLRELVCSVCVEDDAGKPIFDAADTGALGGVPGAVLDSVVSVAFRLSGLGDDERKELEGN